MSTEELLKKWNIDRNDEWMDYAKRALKMTSSYTDEEIDFLFEVDDSGKVISFVGDVMFNYMRFMYLLGVIDGQTLEFKEQNEAWKKRNLSNYKTVEQ